jgi:hypothetical protein
VDGTSDPIFDAELSFEAAALISHTKQRHFPEDHILILTDTRTAKYLTTKEMRGFIPKRHNQDTSGIYLQALFHAQVYSTFSYSYETVSLGIHKNC